MIRALFKAPAYYEETTLLLYPGGTPLFSIRVRINICGLRFYRKYIWDLRITASEHFDIWGLRIETKSQNKSKFKSFNTLSIYLWYSTKFYGSGSPKFVTIHLGFLNFLET